MHEYGDMEKKNWLMFFAGLSIFVLGFIVLAVVGKDFHGFKGFLAPFLLILGLVVIAWGFIYTDKKES